MNKILVNTLNIIQGNIQKANPQTSFSILAKVTDGSLLTEVLDEHDLILSSDAQQNLRENIAQDKGTDTANCIPADLDDLNYLTQHPKLKVVHKDDVRDAVDNQDLSGVIKDLQSNTAKA